MLETTNVDKKIELHQLIDFSGSNSMTPELIQDVIESTEEFDRNFDFQAAVAHIEEKKAAACCE